MPAQPPAPDIPAFRHVNPNGTSALVLVCEHASAHMPDAYNHLGLPPAARAAHIAWDPGALAVAERMSDLLDARLVAATQSRLIYDCNRPPDAAGAMPAKSEVYEIPGNTGLSDADRQARIDGVYTPFHTAVSDTLSGVAAPVLLTVHSFTPVFHGKPRSVEIGLLHDRDSRFADAMLDVADDHTTHVVERNAPYGPDDGVTHTLQRHALPHGHPNVMVEVRNDLIQSEAQQTAMGDILARWVCAAHAHLGYAGAITCTA